MIQTVTFATMLLRKRKANEEDWRWRDSRIKSSARRYLNGMEQVEEQAQGGKGREADM